MALTSANVRCILLVIGCGATAFGTRFRRYSLRIIPLLIVFGALASLDGPRLAANQPTPWLGVAERLTIGGYLLWVAAFVVVGTPARPVRTPTAPH